MLALLGDEVIVNDMSATRSEIAGARYCTVIFT